MYPYSAPVSTYPSASAPTDAAIIPSMLAQTQQSLEHLEAQLLNIRERIHGPRPTEAEPPNIVGGPSPCLGDRVRRIQYVTGGLVKLAQEIQESL